MLCVAPGYASDTSDRRRSEKGQQARINELEARLESQRADNARAVDGLQQHCAEMGTAIVATRSELAAAEASHASEVETLRLRVNELSKSQELNKAEREHADRQLHKSMIEQHERLQQRQDDLADSVGRLEDALAKLEDKSALQIGQLEKLAEASHAQTTRDQAQLQGQLEEVLQRLHGIEPKVVALEARFSELHNAAEAAAKAAADAAASRSTWQALDAEKMNHDLALALQKTQEGVNALLPADKKWCDFLEQANRALVAAWQMTERRLTQLQAKVDILGLPSDDVDIEEDGEMGQGSLELGPTMAQASQEETDQGARQDGSSAQAAQLLGGQGAGAGQKGVASLRAFVMGKLSQMSMQKADRGAVDALTTRFLALDKDMGMLRTGVGDNDGSVEMRVTRLEKVMEGNGFLIHALTAVARRAKVLVSAFGLACACAYVIGGIYHSRRQTETGTCKHVPTRLDSLYCRGFCSTTRKGRLAQKGARPPWTLRRSMGRELDKTD